MLTVNELFDLTHSLAGDFLAGFTWPWEALPHIKEEILRLIGTLPRDEYRELAPGVWAHKTVQPAPTASLSGPAIIGPGTEIRPGAFIRGSALVGADCVIGNSVELKNVIIFDHVQVPHYNYVGDSILGYGAHMGAGAVTSNVKSDRSNVVVRDGRQAIATGLRKMGAMLGDWVEVGCNSVLNPGTVIGRGSRVYPLSSVRGVIPEKHIYKNSGELAAIEERR